LPQRLQKGDVQAAQQGLSLVNQKTVEQFPEAFDKLTQTLLSFFSRRNDLQSLMTLQKNYSAAFQTNNFPVSSSGGPRTTEIEKAIREVLQRYVENVRQLMRLNNPQAKDEGLKALKPELEQYDQERFEALALELGTWLYQRKDGDGLRQLQSQYLNVSRLKRQQAQFDQWLNKLTPPAQPTPPQGAQGGH
jgi:DNA repair exonuclease SbcCD ATPase subunit